MGILLFLLKYMYISLLLKMKYGFSWPAKIMASPFNVCLLSTEDSTQLCNAISYRSFSTKYISEPSITYKIAIIL